MLREAARPAAWRPPLTSLLCLRSCPLAQQLSFLRSGLLSNLYLHTPDCPVPLLQWLFQVRSTDLPLGGGSMLAEQPSQGCMGGGGGVGTSLFWPWVLLGLSQSAKKREESYDDSHHRVQGPAHGLTPFPLECGPHWVLPEPPEGLSLTTCSPAGASIVSRLLCIPKSQVPGPTSSLAVSVEV